MSLIWDAADRRAAGYRWWLPGTTLRSALPAFVATVLIVPATYVATYWSWFVSPSSYMRNWAEQHPGEGISWLPASLRSLVHYHEWMYSFHVSVDAAHGYHHAYSSRALGWIIQWRPTAFYYTQNKGPDAESTCGASNCVSAITALGNPLIWWGAAAALIFALYRFVARFDVLAVTVVAGTLAGWLPWLLYPERIIFTFYTVAFVPYVALTLAWGLRHLAQPPDRGREWSRVGVFVSGGFTALTLIVSGFFVPLWTGQWMPYYYWIVHMWSHHWI